MPLFRYATLACVNGGDREIRWVAVLQAACCLSVPVWESAAPVMAPSRYPAAFAVAVLATATIAMLVLYAAPAFLAARTGEWPRWMLVPATLVAAGLVERIVTVLTIQGPLAPAPAGTICVSALTVGVFVAALFQAGGSRWPFSSQFWAWRSLRSPW